MVHETLYLTHSSEKKYYYTDECEVLASTYFEYAKEKAILYLEDSSNHVIVEVPIHALTPTSLKALNVRMFRGAYGL